MFIARVLPGLPLSLVLAGALLPAVEPVLNEMKLAPSGPDQPFQYLEVLGTPGQALTGHWLVNLDDAGEAVVVVDLGASSLGANGLLVVVAATGNPYTAAAGTTVLPNASLNAGAVIKLAKQPTTFLLIQSAIAITAGTDYDADDNGVASWPIGAVVKDAIGWHEDGDSAIGFVYGPVITVDASHNPDAATRLLGAGSASSAAAWFAGMLDLTTGAGASYDPAPRSSGFPQGGRLTPGALNTVIPVTFEPMGVLLDEDGNVQAVEFSLGSVPTAPVTITSTADGQTQVSSDGVTWGASATLVLSSTAAVTMSTRGTADAVREGGYTHAGLITVAITTSTDANFPLGGLGAIEAAIYDNDAIPAVVPTLETQTFDGRGDADDPAFWIHPTDITQSLVVCSAKKGGLVTFNLDGTPVQSVFGSTGDLIAGGTPHAQLDLGAAQKVRFNNVVVIPAVMLGGVATDLVAVSDRQSDRVRFFAINPVTRLISLVSSPANLRIFTPDSQTSDSQTAYGLAWYRSPVTGLTFVFASRDNHDTVAQLRVREDPANPGTVLASVVRTIGFTGTGAVSADDAQCEGMVVDHARQALYVGQEKVGIWRIEAEPTGAATYNAGEPGRLFARTTSFAGIGGPGSELVADVEGLIIYPTGPERLGGYLLASSQGDNSFRVYDRVSNAYLGSFFIQAGGGVDQVTTCDGGDVSFADLGALWPQGLMVVQDGEDNLTAGTNFKFLSWAAVAASQAPLLKIEPSLRPDEDQPVASDDAALATTEDTSVLVAISTLLANDSDPQGDALAITGALGNRGGAASASGSALVLTPGKDVSGTETFNYTLVDTVPLIGTIPRGQLTVVGTGSASPVAVYDGGSGSAMAPVPGSDTEFWLMTDRGPNTDGPDVVVGSATFASKVFPVPDFHPQLKRVRQRPDGSLDVLGVLTLKDAAGVPLSGLPNPPGAGNAGEVALSVDPVTNTPGATPLPFDPTGLDSEGLVAVADGTFWVSDEYGPWIVRFAANGNTLERFSPFAASSAGNKVPQVFAKRRPNRGMEGLTMTPSGKLVGMMQSALYNPDRSTTHNKSLVVRILVLDPTTHATQQYCYLLENRDTAVSEILAVSDTEFLVLERDGLFAGSGTVRKGIYRISISGATDVSDPADGPLGRLYAGKTVDALLNRAGLDGAAIRPVSKTLAVDLMALAVTYPHDKPEGLALVHGGKTLVVVNDDDFGVTGLGPTVVPKLNPAGGVDGNSLWFIGLDQAAVPVIISPVNDLPVAMNSSATVALPLAPVSGMVSATDAEGDALTYEMLSGPASSDGAFSLSATGAFLFTPAPTFDGQASVTFRAVESAAPANASNIATLTLALPTGTTILQVLHCSDGEASLAAVEDLPRFSAVLNRLRNELPANSLTLSSGDNWLPGPFYNAGGDPALSSVPGIGAASPGRADVAAMNAMAFQASAFGNHEFDAGPREVATIIRPSGAWVGAQFPYLSCNLNFATNSDLAGAVVADGQALGPALRGRITGSATVSVGGTVVGLIGATTPLLPSISSPGSVGVAPLNPTDFAALAAIIQTRVNALRASGVTRIILMTHMQQYAIEINELAPRLDGVDLIIAGGSHSIFADSTDRLRSGDSAAETYPVWRTSLSGEPVAVVNTDGNWRYVGRFHAGFDALGRLIPGSVDPARNGPYATDATGVADLGAGGLVNATVAAIAGGVGDLIAAKDSQVFGKSTVFLNGLRSSVRTEETNLGDLTADANLAAARRVDAATVISLKNGGGIRDAIGTVGTGAVPTYGPPAANPAAGKPVGGISRLDIENSLRFNNSLVVVTITAAQLKEVLEHGVAASTPTGTPGQFPQIGGLRFAWSPSATAQVLSATPAFAVTATGQRIRTAALVDASGATTQVLIQNGAVVGDPTRRLRLVTLGFLEGGGDGYPFPRFAAQNAAFYQRMDLSAGAAAGFAVTGYEQDALADHLLATWPVSGPGFAQADVPPAGDLRIQRLDVRSASFAPVANPATAAVIAGATVAGTLTGSDLDGDPLTFALVGLPTKGSATVAATGAFTYRANAGTLGTDVFTFRVNDGHLNSATAAVTITITAAPTGGNDGNDNDDSSCGSGSGLALIALGFAGLGLVRRRRR